MQRRQQPSDERIGKHVAAPAPRHLVVQDRKRGQPATEHNRVRVEQIDDARESAGQTFDIALDCRSAVGLAGAGARRDFRRGQSGPAAMPVPTMTQMIGGETGAGQKRLDTAAPSAIAWRSRQFLGARRRERVVAPFAGDRVGADQQAAADDDAAADAGAKNRAEHGVEPGRRAVDCLGQGKAICVVRKAYLALERGLDIAGQVSADQPGRVGILDPPGSRDDRSRNTDADRGAGSDLVFKRRDETGDCRDGGVVIARGRGDATRSGNGACRVDRGGGDLGAAKVDANAEAGLRERSVSRSCHCSLLFPFRPTAGSSVTASMLTGC